MHDCLRQPVEQRHLRALIRCMRIRVAIADTQQPAAADLQRQQCIAIGHVAPLRVHRFQRHRLRIAAIAVQFAAVGGEFERDRSAGGFDARARHFVSPRQATASSTPGA